MRNLGSAGVAVGVLFCWAWLLAGVVACNSHMVRRAAPTFPAPTMQPDAPCDPALPCSVGADTLYLRAARP